MISDFLHFPFVLTRSTGPAYLGQVCPLKCRLHSLLMTVGTMN